MLSVYSAAEDPGETVAIIAVFARPVNASRSTCVSFEPRKGVCDEPLSIARIHSFRQSRLLLISAPSRRVCRSLDDASAARSEPARSTSEWRPRARAASRPPPAGSRASADTSLLVAPTARSSSAWRTKPRMSSPRLLLAEPDDGDAPLAVLEHLEPVVLVEVEHPPRYTSKKATVRRHPTSPAAAITSRAARA